MATAGLDEAIALHAGELGGESETVHAQVIRELLAVEENVELAGAGNGETPFFPYRRLQKRFPCC